MQGFYDLFDPIRWGVSYEVYHSWWIMAIFTFFKGLIPKVIATSCLILSIYSVLRRKFSPVFALAMFIVSVFFAYFCGVLNYLI